MRALLLSLALLAGCKGDRDKCEAVCRHASELLYWRDADLAIAKVPEGERAALRKKYLGMFDSKLENGVELCISQCTSANNDDLNKCMLEAKTGDEVLACQKE